MPPETIASLDKVVRQLVLALLKRKGVLNEQIKALLARIAELEARLGAPHKTPINNASERGLRTSVIFRKLTNGFRSSWGAEVCADLCSIVATGRLAGRTPLASLRQAFA
jgi:transposase